ncbi:unnamed protein product [Diamesa serratosioi]
MSFSNSPISFLEDDKYEVERMVALKYIVEREQRAELIENILAPIGPQDVFIFDIARVNCNVDAASEFSELSDPFAELGGNIILSAENNQKRRLSKVEADVLVMNSFPSTHMQIQNEVIGEMNISSATQINIQQIMKLNLDDDQDDGNVSEVFQEVTEILDSCGLGVYQEEKKKREEMEKVKNPKPRLKKTKSPEDCDIDTNSLSAIWRMLDAVSMDNGFPITQPGYNFFEDKKCWINQAEKTWEQKEQVRKKCEEWLKNVK